MNIHIYKSGIIAGKSVFTQLDPILLGMRQAQPITDFIKNAQKDGRVVKVHGSEEEALIGQALETLEENITHINHEQIQALRKLVFQTQDS